MQLRSFVPTSKEFIRHHSLISSCLCILPLLLSRKATCVSLYCVMTSTNFLDRMVCWGRATRTKAEKCVNKQIFTTLSFLLCQRTIGTFEWTGLIYLGSNAAEATFILQAGGTCTSGPLRACWPVFSESWSQRCTCLLRRLWACFAPWLLKQSRDVIKKTKQQTTSASHRFPKKTISLTFQLRPHHVRVAFDVTCERVQLILCFFKQMKSVSVPPCKHWIFSAFIL